VNTLPPSLKTEIARVLSIYNGGAVAITSAHAVGGGCINHASRVETSAGAWFLKHNAKAPERMFLQEAVGLRALQATGAITVPEPIAASDGSDDFPPYLLTTWIESAPCAPDYERQLGRRLARLHRAGRGDAYGFQDDNFLGTTPQPNPRTQSWVEFFREHRLRHQLDLAARNGHGGELQTLGARLLDRLPGLIPEPTDPPTLIHGDLWSGNHLPGPDGHAALMDPAAYHAHREAELAMTRLFGGFTPDFEAGYADEWPLDDGSDARIDIYTLYHLLNHLNLFGTGYLGQCLDLLRRVE